MNEILNSSIKYQGKIYSNWRSLSKNCVLEVWDRIEDAKDTTATAEIV